MLHIDLCCGLGGWQAPFREAENWTTVGVDIRADLKPDVVGDVRQLPIRACQPDLLTMSPPCTEFARWDLPWLPDEDPDMTLVETCLTTVEALKPRWWVLENNRGLHRWWKPARKRAGAFYLWGEFPPFDVAADWPGKMQTPGERPEQRAEIPFTLADSLRRAVEIWTV